MWATLTVVVTPPSTTTSCEPQRDEYLTSLRACPAPGADMALYAVIGAPVALGAQQLEQALRRQPLARRSLAVRLQQTIEPPDKLAQSRLRLNPALIAKLGRRSPDRLANRLPRNPQLAHDLADRLVVHQKRPPDPANRFHRNHPRPRSPKHNQGEHSTIRRGGSLFDAVHHPSRVSLSRYFPSLFLYLCL